MSTDKFFEELRWRVKLKMAKLLETSNHLFEGDWTYEDRMELWDTYHNSIPSELNPIYLERNVYDCNCCKHFIRKAGTLVAIKDDLSLDTIWNVTCEEPLAQEIADKLHAFVINKPLSTKFISNERHIGQSTNKRLFEDGTVVEFSHMYSPKIEGHSHFSSSIGEESGKFNGTLQVFKRALDTLTEDAVTTVIELSESGALYRGNEFLVTVKAFKELLVRYNATLEPLKSRLPFHFINTNKNLAVLRIRNSAIGTLLVDLSEGVDLETAVRKYEAVVAPANYQRTSALVTPKMVEDAKKKVEELGLKDALVRRHATFDDLNVNDLLFVDRSSMIKDDDLFSGVANKSSISNAKSAQEVRIEDFISNILPESTKVELGVTRSLMSNMFNLTTAKESDAPQLFKWDNSFSWSYKGGVTDSIKERVKNAGGVVDAAICIRLAWDYDHDLDVHLKGASNLHVYYGNKKDKGWALDVDANAGAVVPQPVENIFARSVSALSDGVYTISVHNFWKRNDTSTGFDMEIVLLDETFSISYPRALRHEETVKVGSIVVEKGVPRFVSAIDAKSEEVRSLTNGVAVGDFVQVQGISLSPNYWGESEEGSGNKHYFFYLKDYQTDENVRGFYNEFLRNDLKEYRKVFELLGNKTSISPSDKQLGGLGFSETLRNSVMVRVTDSNNKQRMYKIIF